MFSLETVSVVIVGYLLGSIPFGVIVAKRMGVDIYSVAVVILGQPMSCAQ